MLRINDELAIIQTVDFFAPVVDDPYEFGMIAAANSMSDVFAMGGLVTMGLNIAAFPDDLDIGILSEIIRGGSDKMAEAGGVIAGGHTVTDVEPKYGISVTGRIHPDRIWTKAGAKPGDRLFLTKPLGTGILTTAAKQERIDRQGLSEAVGQMSLLNLHARNIAAQHTVHAATDVTGFGLFGHAWEIASRSNVAMNLRAAQLPVLQDVFALIDEGVAAGGLNRNRDHYLSLEGAFHIDDDVPTEHFALGFDPQTSGGLLFSVPADSADALVADFAAKDARIWEIGDVREGTGVYVSSSASG